MQKFCKWEIGNCRGRLKMEKRYYIIIIGVAVRISSEQFRKQRPI